MLYGGTRVFVLIEVKLGTIINNCYESPPLQQSQKRLDFIDLSKVIGIYLVIYGHYIWYMGIPPKNDSLVCYIDRFVTLFHMPLFFIISGVLFKQDKFMNIIRKVFSRLILPYVLIHIYVISKR